MRDTGENSFAGLSEKCPEEGNSQGLGSQGRLSERGDLLLLLLFAILLIGLFICLLTEVALTQ